MSDAKEFKDSNSNNDHRIVFMSYNYNSHPKFWTDYLLCIALQVIFLGGFAVGIVFLGFHMMDMKNEMDLRDEFDDCPKAICIITDSNFIVDAGKCYVQATYSSAILQPRNITLVYPPLGTASALEMEKWRLSLTSPTECWILSDLKHAITDKPAKEDYGKNYGWSIAGIIILSLLWCGIAGSFLEENEFEYNKFMGRRN